MQAVITFATSLFWGVLLLSVLVFVHEGGHFLAARACGVRVTEFFLGLPCRYRIGRPSKRCGTTFGITPLLLGGYAAICGMEHVDAPHADKTLSLVHAKGHATVSDVASELGISEEEALDTCVMLMNWGSIAPVYDESDPKSHSYYPMEYASAPRDAAGYTTLDGRKFDSRNATKVGESWVAPFSDEELLSRERSCTYDGVGFWKKILMLLAGIFVNVICGILLLMSVYSIIGFLVPQDVNTIGSVTEGSPAQAAGVVAGDQITEINGTPTTTWLEIVDAIDAAEEDGLESFSLTYVHDGAEHKATVAPDSDGVIGIQIYQELVRFSLIDSARLAFDYFAQTAQGVASLLVPTKTMEVLDQSTSIVGVSVMSAQAAAAGPTTFLTFAGLISMSLGMMNLLPIPPLDGGRILIEIIQLVRRKRISTRTQNIITYVGIGLFALLFVYMLRTDIIRFVL